jgi:hypothetical protein
MAFVDASAMLLKQTGSKAMPIIPAAHSPIIENLVFIARMRLVPLVEQPAKHTPAPAFLLASFCLFFDCSFISTFPLIRPSPILGYSLLNSVVCGWHRMLLRKN